MANPPQNEEKQPPGPRYSSTFTGPAKGFAIGDGAKVEITEGQPSAAPPAPPGVEINLLTSVLPTAYCRHLDASAFPLVAITVDNTGQGCGSSSIRASAEIQGCSDAAVMTLDLAQGEQKRLRLLPLLKQSVVAELNEIRPATLRIVVDQLSPVSRTLYDETARMYLQARDVALIALRAADNAIVDLTRCLAAWVTPRRPEIEQLLRKAVERHPGRSIVGYQGAASLAQGTLIVREQARAIFNTLKHDSKLVYVQSTLSLGAQAGQIAQRVRLPVDSLKAGGSANCLDGTVLFASLLELASIDPVIVIVPGHAFVGWRVWRGVDRYEFVETTLISSAEFDEAQRSAQDRYDDAVMKGYLSRGLFDPGGFARLIDVAGCRSQEIFPLE